MTSPAIDFTIGKGDILPWLVVTPQTAIGSAITPSGPITFVITNPDTGVSTTGGGATDLFTDTDSVVKLRYKWATADTATAGRFYGQFKDAFGGTDQESFPNNDKILFEVFDKSPGVILTNGADYDSVISSLGVTISDFSYDDIKSIGFLQAAESKIIDTLTAQSGYGTTVPTIAQIMAGTSPATALDKTHLKAAVVYQIAYLFGPGETNSVDVSQSVGPVSRDLGGIGETWRPQMTEYEIQCDYHISHITNFKKWRVLV